MSSGELFDSSEFVQLGLSTDFSPILSDLGFSKPTPIQQKVIPAILIGKDILAIAQTGTGKTASFLLPMIDILSVSRARTRIPRALILSPTRELALQTAEQAKTFAANRGLTCAILIGGSHGASQWKLLERGADIVIATPGRLIDTIHRGKVILRGVSIAVIDEADRMLDMGFIPAVTEIVSHLPKSRQTLMFSATLPKEAKSLAERFLTDPKRIQVAASSQQAKLVSQTFIICPSRQRKAAILASLKANPPERGIIFCNRKITVDSLYRNIQNEGFLARPMHGDLMQRHRQESLYQLKTRSGTILVCSDVAARGLDINNLTHVYNFDFPKNSDDYIHRIGRTGRAGKTGEAISFLDDDWKDNLRPLAGFLKESDCRFIEYTGDGSFVTINNLAEAAEQASSRTGDARKKRRSSNTRRTRKTDHRTSNESYDQSNLDAAPSPKPPRTARVPRSSRKQDPRPPQSRQQQQSSDSSQSRRMPGKSSRHDTGRNHKRVKQIPDDRLPAFLEDPLQQEMTRKSLQSPMPREPLPKDAGFDSESLPEFLRPQ